MPKTQTRRKPNERIISKLDELRGLIERHCGDTEQVVREAVVAALSPQQMPVVMPNGMPVVMPNGMPALSPQQMPVVMPNGMPIEVKKRGATCPGGPKVWNEFQKTYKDTNPRMQGETYKDFQARMRTAYQVSACALPTKTRKAAPVMRTLGIRNIYSNIDPRLEAIKTHTQSAYAELDTLAANYPSLQNNINAIRKKADIQQKRVNSMERQIGDQFENKNNVKQQQRNAYTQILNVLNTRKQKLNTGMQTLRAKVNTLKPKQQVRVMAPTNAFPVVPGENSLVLSSNIPSLNNALKGASSAVTTPNKSLLLQPVQTNAKSPSLTTNANANANAKSTMIFNGVINENSGYRPVNINGKKYFYRESNNRLVERMNNNNQGNTRGYYNETYPGYFRPNNE
jgi:hypothetical protein